MGISEGRFGRWTWGMRTAVLFAAVAASATPARAYVASTDDHSLLAFTNSARAQHNLPPLVWHDGLGHAAQVNSSNLAAREGNCDPHNCGMEWWRRVEKYYPGMAAGENYASNVPNPRALHDDWMSSTAHRANILSSGASEFGAGIVLGQTNVGLWAFATEDFGWRAVTIPILPAGGVAPRLGYSTTARELIVNYYNPGGGAPQAVRALVGSSCVPLSRVAGSTTNGSWGTTRSFSGSGCVPIVFEAISNGVRYRWPESGAILIGVGTAGLYCGETTSAAPTQDCGGGGSPPPSPTPTPGPSPDGSGLSKLRVVLRPGKQNASKGQVQVQATLPLLSSFSPSDNPLTVRVRFGDSGDWSRSIPATCGSGPCLTTNRQGTTYHGKYDTSNVSLVRSRDGRWRLRFVARNQTLGGVDAGTVSVTVDIDGQTFVGSADGELKPSGLVAN